MMTTQSKSIKNKRKSHLSVKRQLLSGSLIATLVATTPYLFYLHESIPDGKVWDTFLFTFTTKYYDDANYFMWIFTSKALPLYILFIWFFTCRHWWYHVILVPIAMYSYQLFGLFNDENGYIDEYQLIYLLPMMAIVIPSIYLIRAKLFNKMNKNKSLEELEDEFTLRPKGLLGKFKDYF